tara:strand:- start:7976 stop:8860 length:885 start_codon:yes stop_codon:yes gene_type:complete
MGTVFPGGSGVTREFPPPEGGGAPEYTGVKWVTEYEIDFAEYFAANGAKDFCVAASSHTETLDGLDWTAYADGNNLNTNTTVFEINANGLQIRPVDGSSDFWGSTCRGPRVGPFIATAVEASGGPAYNYFEDIVCMQAYITADDDPLTDNYRRFGIILDKHTSSSYDKYLWAFVSHAGSTFAGVNRKTSNQAQYSLTSNPDFFEIIVGNNLANPRGRIGEWTGSFPEPGAPLSVSGGFNGVDASAVIKDTEGAVDNDGISDPTYANARLEVAAATPSALAFMTTVHKVRYLRLR